MAPMQWRDATVGGMGATGFEASRSGAARQEPDVRQVFDQVGRVSEVSVASQFMVADSATALPVGLDLPCTEDPELFFAESPADVETAKAMCRGCKARLACLTGALERREPWGVWGGELLMRGAIVPRKRPRGRPRKAEVAA
jgi:WhiB family redox-sensing transcriptional regulator